MVLLVDKEVHEELRLSWAEARRSRRQRFRWLHAIPRGQV